MRPNRLVKLRRNRVEKLVQGYADSLASDSPRYSNLAVAIMKSFFTNNGFKHAKALELATYHAPPRFRITQEYIPTKSEVYKMADSACSLRDRAMVLTLFSTGLRNSTLRALRYKDIERELSGDFPNVLLPIYPEMKKVEPNACKGMIPYFTFTCDEASQAIKLYIKERKEKHGGVEGDEPLFCSEYNQIDNRRRRERLLTSRSLEMIIKESAKRAGIDQWKALHPHCLRKAYETILHSQLIDGSNMDIKTQEFFMGHVLPGSQDPYFDRSKVEHMRLQYSKLRFGRTTVENRFKVLRMAVARAFEDTDIDVDKVIEDYVKLKNGQPASAD
jgi:integrase